MMSTQRMRKDTIKFEGTHLDVRYHEANNQTVLDTVKVAGTNNDYDVDVNKQQALKNKLSGRG